MEAAGGNLKTMSLRGRTVVTFQVGQCWDLGTGFFEAFAGLQKCQNLTEGDKISVSAWTGVTC